MKSTIVFLVIVLVFLFISRITNAQGVGIGESSFTPDIKAILELQSSEKGLLIPRMTQTQRDAISSTGNTPESLVIYNTTSKCFEAYIDGNWYSVSCPSAPSNCIPPAPPNAIAASSITSTSFSANWDAMIGISDFYLDVSPTSSFTSFVSGYNNLYVGNVTTYSVTGLCGGTYYYRLRAANGCVSANSNIIGPVTVTNTITDIDGNSYFVGQIGSQCWMKSSLRTTKYRDNTPIPNITDGATWSGLSTGAYVCYNNDCPMYKAAYGALYNWFAVNDSRGLCPTGWHIPSDAEWCSMITYLNNTADCNSIDPSDISATAGGVLKETGTTYWQAPNLGATNTGAFNARGAGVRGDDGNWGFFMQHNRIWTITELSSALAWYHVVYYNVAAIQRNSADKRWGMSVRCVKD